MQENLQHLMYKQAAERKFLDDVDKFATICEPLFQKRKFEYFQNMIEKIESVVPTEEKTQILMEEKDVVVLDFEHINDKVISIELQFGHYLAFMVSLRVLEFFFSKIRLNLRSSFT